MTAKTGIYSPVNIRVQNISFTTVDCTGECDLGQYIFGLEEITVDGFFDLYKDLLNKSFFYGFLVCCGAEELRELMV